MPTEKYVTPLEKARKAYSMTQYDVQRETGIQQAIISKAERSLPISRDAAERLVELFGEPLTEIHLLYPERYFEKPFEYKARLLRSKVT